MAEFKTDENAYNEIAKRTAIQKDTQQAQLRQRMEDMGLASQPLTIQSQNEMADKSNMGDITRQQQGQAEFNQALQRQSDLSLGAQQTGLTGQQDFVSSQLEQNQQNQKVDIYYRLFQARKMTARQFEKLTGITVKQQALRSRAQKKAEDPATAFFPDALGSRGNTFLGAAAQGGAYPQASGNKFIGAAAQGGAYKRKPITNEMTKKLARLGIF